MANIDIAQIKSILTAAKKARGSASRIVWSGQQEPSTAVRGIKELLPILEKAGLDVTAVKKTLKEDRAGDDRKPTADAVKRHAWSKKTLVKNMKARAGARRTAVPADSPFNQPTVTQYIQPFYIWPQPAGILTQSNLAADDNWASVWLELTDAPSGGGYVSFLYLWTNTNNFAVGIDVDTSLAFIGYLKATAGAIGGFSGAHVSAIMDIYQMEDEDDNLGPATLSTPLIPVQDVRAEALFVRRSDSAPVDSIVELSNDQAAVSAGASVLIEVYANFVCDSFEGQLFNEPSSALFDFNLEYRIANPGMTITSTPVILF